MIKETHIHNVHESIRLALAGISKLTPEALAVKGFSTPTMRHFFNQLCSLPGINYLEIGAWFGASAVAAAYGNMTLESFVVDDFSQDFCEKGVKESLLDTLAMTRPYTKQLTFIEGSCYEIDKKLITCPIDVYFFDGEHGYPNQVKALGHFLDVMADSFVFIVDDYNWPTVRDGTNDAINKLVSEDVLTEDYRWEILTPVQDDPKWHNGLFISVFSKNK